MRAIRGILSAVDRHWWNWRNGDAFVAPSDDRPPRLLVDVSAIIRHDPRTGIQRVVRAVWSELRNRSGSTFDVVPVFASPAHGYCQAPLDFAPGQPLAGAPRCAQVRPGDAFLGLDLSAHLLPLHIDQVRAWRASGARINIVVYDLLPLTNPDWFNDRTVRNFRRWFAAINTDADRAICISGHVADQLRRRLVAGGPTPQVGQMRLGADIAASLPSAGICAEVARTAERMRVRPAVLMVGTVEPRKGYDSALRAFDHLWSSSPADSPDLVIAGRKGWKTEVLQAEIRAHPKHGERLHWLTGVSDEGLCRLYDACRGVLIASRAEGFGLPLVEAAMARRHVLARNLPVFREQGLANVIYFDDDRPEALGRQILDLAALPREAPSIPADLPTWKDCVDDLLAGIGLGTPAASADPRPLQVAS